MNTKGKEEYKRKLTTCEDAVKSIVPGDWVELGFGAAMAPGLLNALIKRRDELNNINLRDTLMLLPCQDIISPEGQKTFTVNSWFISGRLRGCYQSGKRHDLSGILQRDSRLLRQVPPERFHDDLSISDGRLRLLQLRNRNHLSPGGCR